VRFDVFTLFPEVFEPYLRTSILQRAQQRNLIEIHLFNIRDWASDRHHVTDDEPYGGGGGMVMKPEPIFAAVEEILGSPPICPMILLTPQGRLFTQGVAKELWASAGQDSSGPGRLALLCGRYEGVDERVRQRLVSDEISIGDYVLTGGELAALVVIDAISRLVPGVLGDPGGVEDDSHAAGLLEYPHYTRPAEFRGWRVPEVLVSGDHGRVARWRREQSLLRTWQRRPDLLQRAVENNLLSKEELTYLASLRSSTADPQPDEQDPGDEDPKNVKPLGGRDET
jgi:tRNA (guanine37-N1)-methyltransferase